MSHCRAGSFFAAILNYENTLGTKLLAALHFNEQYMSLPFAAKQMGNEQSFMKSVNARHRSRHGFHYESENFESDEKSRFLLSEEKYPHS